MASKNVADTIGSDNAPDASRARSIVAAAPRIITQHTAGPVLGIPSRRMYFDLCRDFARDGGHVGARGKLRLVDAEKFSAWLLEREKREASRPEGDLLAALGLRAVAGGRP